MRRHPGAAMVVVLVMVLIFATLILAVVLSSTLAFKSAARENSRAVATQAAEAGIQTALYHMNYAGYSTDHYPCTYDDQNTAPLPAQREIHYDPSYRYFDPNASAPVRWVNTPVWFNPTDIPEVKCLVEFEDNDDSASPNQDRMICTARYRGTTARVSVNIRGANGVGNPLHQSRGRFLSGTVGWDTTVQNWDLQVPGTWGVPESFNKHAIYTRQVAASGPACTIDGNVAYLNTSSIVASGKYTLTKIADSTLFDNVLFDTGNCTIPAGPDTGPETYICTFKDGNLYENTRPGKPDYQRPLPLSGAGWSITYDSGGDRYVFTDTSIDYSIEVIGNMEIVGSNSALTDHVKLLQSFTIVPGSTLKTTDTPARMKNAVFHFVPPFGSFESGSLNSVSIIGDLIWEGASCTLIGISVDGGMLTDSNLIIASGLQSSVDASASRLPAAITLKKESSSIILDINGQPIVRVGQHQRTGLLVMASGAGNNATLRLRAVDSRLGDGTIGERPLMAVLSSAGTASLMMANIGATVSGLVYVRGGTSGDVTFSNASTINGVVVANGRVNLGANGTVVYDPIPFKTSSYGGIYRGFYGGRRVYLPLPGSWRVE